MLDIKITRTTSPKEKPDENNLGFGKKFTDHMFVMDYTEGEGWHDARIVPYGPFELDPATVVFHYAQEIFEGMKAYHDTLELSVTDKIWAIILDFVLEAAERYSIDATELLADFIESNPVAHTLRNMYIYKQAS